MIAFALALVLGADDPWSAGPPAPMPTTPAPFPQAPREPGAAQEPIAVPPRPPDPQSAPLDDGVAAPAPDPRFRTVRTRSDLFAHGALDLDTALVDVPGLWLFHAQAGDARMLARGLDDRDLDVTLDGVPLFDLGGLVDPLEQLSLASTARFTLHHGPHAISASNKGAAGVIDVDTLGGMRDFGESLGVHGLLAGGAGGADLEKGVLTAVDAGYGPARVGLEATLLDRQDLRAGRGIGGGPGGALVDGVDPLGGGAYRAGILEHSGGDGGALGARADLVPLRGLHVFTTWHSARSLETPHPGVCGGDDANGNARDCTRTVERGLDLWIAGVDDDIALGGVDVVVRMRAHAQHAIDNEERAGTGIPFVERSFDEGVRAGARAIVDVTLPAVALGDVWTPRASVGADVYADRFSSTFFSRSLFRRDAEPPGNGIEDPSRARLKDGALVPFAALSGTLMAEGARTTLWAAGRVADDASAEVGVRTRVVDELHVYVAGVHLTHDDTVEGGLAWDLAYFSLEGALYGTARDGDTAYGFEGNAALRPGVPGLVARATFAQVFVDDGAIPHPGVPPAAGVLEVDWDAVSGAGAGAAVTPPVGPHFGFVARSRFLFPQTRLSPVEETDHALCPERPTDDQLAAGTTQDKACSGQPGALLFDLGAYVDVGPFRVDAMAENLLDEQMAMRAEPIASGGAAFRALLTVGL